MAFKNAKIRQLETRMSEIRKQQRALVEAAEKADRDLDDDENQLYTEAQAEYEQLESRRDRFAQILQEDNASAAVASSADPDPGPGSIIVKKPEFVRDPKKGFSSHRDFLNGVIKATRAGRVDDPRLRFLVSDRDGRAIHQVGVDGQVVDLSGRPVNITAGSDEQGMYADPYGGFFIPEAFQPGPLTITPEADPMGPRTTKIPMTAPTVKINARVDKDHSSSVSGGFQWYRRAEADTVSSSRASYEQVKLEANSLQGIAYATNELLASSPVSFAAIIAQGFQTELPNKLIKERLDGTGVGEFEGIANAGCKVSVDAETDQDATTIVTENVIKMRSRCWNYQQAIWLYNHDCLPQLMTLVLQIGTGGIPMWLTTAREGEPDMLLGRPAFPTEYCKTLGTSGDIILVVPSEYLEGTYMPYETAESMHVRFVENETAFRVSTMNAGAHWWRTYLTPANSTNYLSPVVYLASRT